HNERVQAFTVQGATSNYFGDDLPWIQLRRTDEEGVKVEWLDMVREDTGLLYILSYTGDGSRVEMYRVDIHDRKGKFISRTKGVAAAKIAVDKFRTLYTANYQLIVGPDQRPEPSISKWAARGALRLAISDAAMGL